MAGQVCCSVPLSLDGCIVPASCEDMMGQQWLERQQWVRPQRFCRESLKGR